jgi:heme oxygenase
MQQQRCRITPTLHDILRRETRELHVALENVPAMSSFMSATADVSDYYHHLKVMYGYLRPLESSLLKAAAIPGAIAGGSVPSWQVVPRHETLANDLRQGGIDPEQLPQADDEYLPVMSCDVDAFGAGYVLEGSRLGGKLIDRHLERTFGDQLPRQYYADSNEPGRWPGFVDTLNTIENRQLQERISSVAVATFRGLLKWSSERRQIDE